MNSWERLILLQELEDVEAEIKEDRERDDFDSKRLKALVKKKERILIQLNS